MKRIYNIAAAFFFLLFLGCMFFSASSYIKENRQKESASLPPEEAKSSMLEMEKEQAKTGEKQFKTPEILKKYKKLYNENPDMIGWLQIEGTPVNYPVVQRKKDTGYYYLDHGFDGRKDRFGTPFLDAECDILKPSTNFIIYAHNMKNDTMFGSLDRYRDISYYKKHPFIRFDTIYETGTYEIVSVFISKVYHENENAFKYYQFIQSNTEKDMQRFIENVEEISLYDTGKKITGKQQLLTLSTCSYSVENGRFVVVAQKTGP